MAQQPPQQPLFGLVPAGQPLITTPSSQPSATSFLYAIPSSAPKPFAHLAVFLLPGITLPENTAAAIYLALNPIALASGSEPPNFRFLGGVGPGKESAVFKLSAAASPSTSEGGVILGIAVEDAGSVAERIQRLHGDGAAERGLGQGQGRPSTQVLAQRIIQNAFNFLAGFSGTVGAGGVEVVPLKAFQEWWRKFESKIQNDPTFLEREQN